MRKKNIFLLSLLIFLIVLMIGFVVFVFTNKVILEEPYDDTNRVIYEDLELVELTGKKGEIFNTLKLYGKEIYGNNGYVGFNKNEDGVYYASINDLIDLNYDASMIDDKCDKDQPLIYFDVNYKMVDEYPEEPILVVLECYK